MANTSLENSRHSYTGLLEYIISRCPPLVHPSMLSVRLASQPAGQKASYVQTGSCTTDIEEIYIMIIECIAKYGHPVIGPLIVAILAV